MTDGPIQPVRFVQPLADDGEVSVSRHDGPGGDSPTVAPPATEPGTPAGGVADPQRARRAGATPGRLIGPDVVRALALIGVVVMNFHGYLLHRGAAQSDNFAGRLFDTGDGPLTTRFAATFVLTAGVGTTLFTRRAFGDRAATSAKRWTLMRRGLLLYGVGLIVDMIWEGTILPFYGGMFFLAAFLFTLPTIVLAVIGVGAALAGSGIHWWGLEQAIDGHPASWLYNTTPRSPRGLVFDLFVNGTHPLLPWLAFFCAGMILGRLLRTGWWQPVVLAIGVTMFSFATVISDQLTAPDRTPLSQALASDSPWDRGLLYSASSLGTALVAFTAIYTIATRLRSHGIVRAFAHAGQMTLSLYLLHIVAFCAFVDWWDWVNPTGLDTALTFAFVYWVFAIAFGWFWHRRFGIGPIEWLYRKLTA